jgi:hypothetical protein
MVQKSAKSPYSCVFVFFFTKTSRVLILSSFVLTDCFTGARYRAHCEQFCPSIFTGRTETGPISGGFKSLHDLIQKQYIFQYYQNEHTIVGSDFFAFDHMVKQTNTVSKQKIKLKQDGRQGQYCASFACTGRKK